MTRVIRHFPPLVLALAVAPTLRGQELPVFEFPPVDVLRFPQRAGPFIDAEHDLGLVPGSNPTVDNAAKWAEGMADKAAYFRPFDLSGRAFYFMTPMRVTGTARRIQGTGLHRASKADTPRGGQSYGSPTRLVYDGPQLNFDGASLTAHTDSPGDTITLVGRSVEPTDVNLVLKITGGTNFIYDNPTPAGEWDGDTYIVLAVDIEKNTWTLDRNCTRGAGSGMVGVASGTLVRDISYGGHYSGLYLTGRAPRNYQGRANHTPGALGEPRAFVGWHIVSQWTNRDGDNETYGLNTGKHRFDACTFVDFEIALMCAPAADRAHDQARTFFGAGYNPGSAGHSNHSDHITGSHLWFHGCRTGIHLRAAQSVSHYFRKLRFLGVENCIYAERGGMLNVVGVELDSGNVDGWTFLRLGRQAYRNAGYFPIRDFRVDASANPGAQKLLTTDMAMRSASGEGPIVVFDGGTLSSVSRAGSRYWEAEDYTGLFDVVGAQHVVIQNYRHLGPGSIRLFGGTHATVRNTPRVTLRDCTTISVSDIKDLIRWEDSDSGSTGWRIDCYNVWNERNSVLLSETMIDGVAVPWRKITHEDRPE